jgi:hypothetical protein
VWAAQARKDFDVLVERIAARCTRISVLMWLPA